MMNALISGMSNKGLKKDLERKKIGALYRTPEVLGVGEAEQRWTMNIHETIQKDRESQLR